jgi:hypothetical protein
MSRSELERELAVADGLKLLHPTWKNAASEYRRILRQPRSCAASTARTRRPASSGAGAPVLALPPPELEALARALSAVISRIHDGRHSLYLALSGTLLTRGVDPSALPALVAKIARSAGDAKVPERVNDAVSTVRTRQRGGAITGFLTLRADWPDVAAALDAQLPPTPSAARNYVTSTLQVVTSSRTLPLAAALPNLRAILERGLRSPSEVTVGKISPGAGKTREALEAARRSGARVAFAHPTNSVAIEQYRLGNSREPGAILRRFGALSVLGTNGLPVCTKAAVARVLQEGGMPVPHRLCLRCADRQACTARNGIEGPSNARIAVVNHGLLDAALEHVGTAGALVIDELPPVALHLDISAADLDVTLRCLRFGTFSSVLSRPAVIIVELLRVATDVADHEEPLGSSLAKAVAVHNDPAALLRRIENAHGFLSRQTQVDEEELDLDSFDLPKTVMPPPLTGRIHDDALALLGSTIRQWPNHSVPPTTRAMSRRLVSASADSAKEVALASRVLARLGYLSNSPIDDPVAPLARWEVLGDGDDDLKATLMITAPNEPLRRCLSHAGPLIVLDATPDLVALERLSRRPIRIDNIDVSDGVPVARRILATFRGAKSALAPGRRMAWEAFGPLLCEALLLAGVSQFGNVLLITHKPCADALRSAIPSRVPHERLAWMLRARAEAARLVIEHFGNVKGRNEFDGLAWSSIDGLITLGDPWPDLRLIRRENQMLRLAPEQADQRSADLAAAELAQAHGRLRAPRQIKATCAVHVGAIIPAGWSLANTTVHQLQDGRPIQPSAMSVGELCAYITRAGGNRALARAIGCSDSTIRRYFGGKPIPIEFANGLRRIYSEPSPHSSLAAQAANDVAR